eukprot:1157323-Pelagomonas_calceolata.AAC.3
MRQPISTQALHCQYLPSLCLCFFMYKSLSQPHTHHDVQLCYRPGLLDIFLFVYIGITVFTLEIFSIWRFAPGNGLLCAATNVCHKRLQALCLISIAAGRLVGILCSVAVPNLLRPPQRRMGPKVLVRGYGERKQLGFKDKSGMLTFLASLKCALGKLLASFDSHAVSWLAS